MRIDGKTQLGMEQLDYASRKKNVEKRSGEGEKTSVIHPAVTADKVTISGQAKESVSFVRTLKELPDVREDRVAELKARIAEGSYNVPGKDIAEKMVSTALNGLF